MQLELKHITGYLPYGLKILDFVNGGKSLIDDTYLLDPKNCHRCLTFAKETEKPILRPLSDLEKEIEVNGEKFVPLYKLCKMQGFTMSNDWEYSFNTEFNIVAMMKSKDWIFRYMNSEKSFWLNGTADYNKKHQKSHKQLEMFEKLYEWHFEIHGLIEKRLAININTLNE